MIHDPNLNVQPTKIIEDIQEAAGITEPQPTVDNTQSSNLAQTSNTLKNINIIKDELCKLPLDTCELDYVTTNVLPLLTILYELSTTAFNLASSSNMLSISSVVHPKRHELKDSVHLAYKINDECEDLYDVLKKRINLVLKNSSEK